jgi:hypothetical protein
MVPLFFLLGEFSLYSGINYSLLERDENILIQFLDTQDPNSQESPLFIDTDNEFFEEDSAYSTSKGCVLSFMALMPSLYLFHTGFNPKKYNYFSRHKWFSIFVNAP